MSRLAALACTRVFVALHKDTGTYAKGCDGSMQIYAGSGLRISADGAKRRRRATRILGYRIHECPGPVPHSKSCTPAPKVRLLVTRTYMYNSINSTYAYTGRVPRATGIVEIQTVWKIAFPSRFLSFFLSFFLFCCTRQARRTSRSLYVRRPVEQIVRTRSWKPSRKVYQEVIFCLKLPSSFAVRRLNFDSH